MPVQLQSTYRVDSAPPEFGSLNPGELFVQFDVPGGGPPRLWVGTSQDNGYPGNVTLIVGDDLNVTPSDITVEDVANPSEDNTVHVMGNVEPGARIELAALAGPDINHLTQLNPWSPYDASSGTFDVTWWLPAADDVRIRVRMHDAPDVYVDSNLFKVNDPAFKWPVEG